MDTFCGSEFWNTNYTWTSNEPRFTPCFEETVLLWIPCAFLWLPSIPEIYISSRSKFRFIESNWLNRSKLVTCGILIILTLLDFQYALFWHPAEKVMHAVDYSSSLLKNFTFILAGFIIVIHQKCGIRTSPVMFVFWFLLCLCGLPHFLSTLNALSYKENLPPDYLYVSNVIYYFLIVFLCILSAFTDACPRYSQYPPVQKQCPDMSVSFLCSWITLWFDPMAWKFYKRTVHIDELWDPEYESSIKYLVPKFEKFWNMYSRKKRKRILFSNIFELNGFMNRKLKRYDQLENNQRTSILPILRKCFGFIYLRASLFKFCSDMLVFVNPLLLSLLIRFGENDEPTWHGYIYAVLTLTVTSFQTLFIDWYVFKVFDLGIRMRSTLTAIIYKKALRISSIARRSFTLGEITNLMSVDAQRFVEVSLYLNMALSGLYQISIAMYFLWSFLGPSMLAGLAVMLILIPLNGAVATKAKTFQIQQMKYKDERIKISTEVLSGIKTLKMYAWETSFEDKILKIREKEIEQLKRIAYLNTAVSFIWGCAPFLVSLVSFAVFTLSSADNVLSAETAFVSLALFNIIRLPISLFPRIFPNLVQTYVAIKRIDKFLNAEELDDFAVNHNKLEKHAIVFKDSSFSWEKIGSPMLRNINITVPNGSLVAVVGSVGAGKSSLVSALLGEMYKVNGYVNIRGSVAYVPQQAWLLNDTLRNNIVFSSHYNPGKYDRVVEACSLTADLKILPGGDHTEIGEKGVNLSGGQKQRISLARAIYHDADIYLLDDPLSAVDAHVGKHIFENVIGPNGLLRKKTRFFVTHAISFLPEVDFIIVMTNGQISDQGTYNELISKGGAFSEFLTNHTNEINIDEAEENLPKKKIMRSISEDSDVGYYVSPIGSQISTESATHSIVVGEKLIEDEYIESGNVKSDIYLHYFKCGNIKLWISAVLFEIMFQGFAILTTFSLSNWSTDPAAVTDGVQDIGIRNFYLSIYCGFGIGQFLFVFLTTFCIYKASVNASSYMHFAILHKILRWPNYMFDVTPIGRILTRLSFDMDIIDNTIPFTLMEMFNIMGAVISVLFVIIYNSPLLIFAVIPITLAYIVIERVYVSIERQLKRLESASRSPIYSHFGETLSGAAVIRAYGVVKNFISKSEHLININQIYTFASTIATRWVGNRMNILGNTIIFFTALLSVVERNTLNSGIIGLSLTYVFQIGGILFWVVKMATDLETNIVSVERLHQCEHTAPEEEIDKKLLSSKVSVSWPENGEIEFKNFKVRYRKDLDFVLHGINFKAKPGENVGIVGRTGAGKSSLTLSLFRIVEAAAGSIKIDGVDISTIDLYTLRSRITIIPQDPVIFSGSLRFNLDPFSRYSDQKIFHALELAHLKDYVLSLPNKLHHVISESGENLSIGQRQLLCLARALLRKTKILILDEATAAVDLETDDLIQQTIRTEFKNCTVFTIAHRLNTIMDSDRVIVLDKGLIVEFNAPNILLNSKDTLFYQMAKDAGIVS